MQLAERDENKFVWGIPALSTQGIALLRVAVANGVNHGWSPFLWSPRQDEDTAWLGQSVSRHLPTVQAAKTFFSFPSKRGLVPSW